MDQVLKAAFMFIAPEADPAQHRTWMKTPKVHLLAIGVGSYDQAASVARKIVEEDGIAAIELCGGFGNVGAARVAEAVDVPVGVVRFDIHPGLGNASGDTIF